MSGRLSFGVGLDNTELLRGAEETRSALKDIGNQAEVEGLRMDKAFSTVSSTIKSLIGPVTLGLFVKKMFEVRSSFQDAESSLKVFLGTAEKASDFINQLKDYAWYNMFEFSDLVEESSKLMAFGTAAEDVIPVLDRLSNIASGTKGSLADLVNTYNRAKGFDRLDSHMLQSLAAKGVVVTQTLQEMGIEVDRSALRFEHLEMVINELTDEGGKFYGMMDEQMQNLSASLGQLQDDFAIMLDEIGTKMQGTMKTSIESVSWLIDNYKKIGTVLLHLIATYGAYRAALIVNSAVLKVNTLMQLEAALAGKTLTSAQALLAIGTKKLSTVWALLNKTLLANPIVLVVTAFTALISAVILYSDKTSAAEKATKEFNQELESLNRKQEEELNKANNLINVIRDKTRADGERIQALKDLVQEYPNILEKYDVEILSLEEILQLQKDINEEQAKRYTSSLQEKYDEQLAIVEAAKDAFEKEMKEQGWDEKRNSNLPQLQERLYRAKAKLFHYEMEIHKDKANQLMSDLTGYSNEDLEREVDKREKLLAKVIKKQEEFDKKGIKKKAVGTLKDWGTFSKEDLESQTNLFIREINRRQANKVTGLQLLKEYQKELEKLLQEESEIYNSHMEEGQKKRALEDVRAKIKDITGWIDFYTLKSQTIDKGNKKTQKELVDNTLREKRLLEDLKFQTEEAELAVLEEGTEKELALLALHHKKKQTLLTRQEEDLLEQLQDFREEEWEASGGKGKFDRSKITLSDTETNWFQSLRNSEKETYEKDVDAVHQKLLQKYRNFVEQKSDIEQKFNKDIAELTIKYGADSNPVKEATKQMNEALDKLKKDVLQENGKGVLELFLYGDGSQLITDKIRTALPLFEDITKLTFNELEKAKTAVSELKFTPEQLELFKAVGVDVEKLKAALEEAKEAADEMLDEQRWEKILGIAQKLGSSLSKLGSALSESSGVLGEIGKTITALAGSIDDITTAFTSTKPEEIISSGISGLATIFSTIISQVEKNKQAQEEWNQKIREAAHAAAMARIEVEAYKEGNLFGVEDPYAKAVAGANKYVAAMSELREMSNLLGEGQVQIGTKKVGDAGNIAAGMGGGAAVGAAIGTAVGGWALGLGTIIGAAIGAIVGGVTTGLAAPKVVAVFDSLANQYGEIFDPDTFELNPDILKNYKKFDDATRGLIDNWEEIRSKALEAQEEMRNTFRELAGDIGGQLSDALVDAFRDGDVFSAIDDFKDKVTQVIENIISQMIFARYFQDLFDDLEEEMNDSFGMDGDNDIVDDVIRFFDRIEGRVDGYGDAMEKIKQGLSEQGWDIFGSSRSAEAKGFQAMSQDSANELNGRFAALQIYTYQIAENMKLLFVNSTQSLTHLAAIERNTARLEKIEQSMGYVKTGIESINVKGVHLR